MKITLFFAFSSQLVERLLMEREVRSQFPGWLNPTQIGYDSPPLLHLFNRNFLPKILSVKLKFYRENKNLTKFIEIFQFSQFTLEPYKLHNKTGIIVIDENKQEKSEIFKIFLHTRFKQMDDRNSRHVFFLFLLSYFQTNKLENFLLLFITRERQGLAA